jgi:MoxR-like ATPase
MMAVNAAVTLQRPLLVKGEPGTGKTLLAIEVAKALGKQLLEWHIKSTTKAQHGLYEYDAVSRLRDSQLGDDRVHDSAARALRVRRCLAAAGLAARRRPGARHQELHPARHAVGGVRLARAGGAADR